MPLYTMEEMKNTKKLTDDCDAAIKTAQFRFALIAPLVQGLVPDGSDTAYFMRITKDPLTLPDGRCVKYSWKTPQKWHYLYKKGGFDALLPKTRSDKGIPRALPDTAIEEIYRLKEKYPRLNATQIHIRLVQDRLYPRQCQRGCRTAFYKEQRPQIFTGTEPEGQEGI